MIKLLLYELKKNYIIFASIIGITLLSWLCLMYLGDMAIVLLISSVYGSNLILCILPLYQFDKEFKTNEVLMWAMIPVHRSKILIGRIVTGAVSASVYTVVSLWMVVMAFPGKDIPLNDPMMLIGIPAVVSFILYFFAVEYCIISYIHLFMKTTSPVTYSLIHILGILLFFMIPAFVFVIFDMQFHLGTVIMVNLVSLGIIGFNSYILNKKMNL